ncbi:MAG: LamG-like jellyroll fold domain-containing protein [Phycisphaeraceae bacterium]
MRDIAHAWRLLFVWSLAAMAWAGTAAEVDAEPIEVELATLPGLRFDVTRFAVEPGAEVKLIVTNRDEMQHNLLITMPGERMAVANAAIALGPDALAREYVPDLDAVLFHTGLLNAGDTGTITFTAPEEEGVYPYVCTIPGHAFVMYGAMYVTRAKELPPLAEDPHVPPAALVEAVAAQAEGEHFAHHGEDAVAGPRVRRTFLSDASPAAIAVHTGRNLSYCWDAATGHLRYAWHGGFIDSEAHWRGKGADFSQVVGDIYYRGPATPPLRLGEPDRLAEMQFRGYRMIEGLPQFHYTLDGYSVKQSITALPEGVGLAMHFEIEDSQQPIHYVTQPYAGVVFTSSAGTWKQNVLTLTPDEATSFTIILAERRGFEPAGYWSMNDMPSSSSFAKEALTEGVVGRAIQFNTGDKVQQLNTDVRASDFDEGGSVAGWFRMRDAEAEEQPIIAAVSDEAEFVLGYNRKGEGLTLTYPDREGETRVLSLDSDRPTAPPTGAWHHVAFIIEGEQITIYIDGVEAGQVRRGPLPDVAFTIGAIDGNARFLGELDELRLWTRTIDVEQLRYIYRREAATQEVQ